MNRLEREHATIRVMIEIYCQAHHSSEANICSDCQELITYAKQRLEHCPYQEAKPTCGDCTIHCYKKDRRARVQKIMRYSGPRMIWKHPIMAVLHIFDGLRKKP